LRTYRRLVAAELTVLRAAAVESAVAPLR